MTFLIFFIIAVIVWAVNLVFLKFLKTLGTKDQQGKIQVRWSAQSKPTIGGISFFIGFLVLLVVALITQGNPGGLLPLLLAAVVAFIAGLLDDAFNTNPLQKFMFQVVCAVILIGGGYVINLDNQLLSFVVSALWIVGLMNSINMLDNMDGISTIASMGVFLGLFLIAPESMSGYLAGGMVFILAGFLMVNWHPSKVFMGDSGSQLLGLLLAALSIAVWWNHDSLLSGNNGVRWIGAVTLFFVPLCDSTLVSINRLRHGQSPFVGGRDHSTHNLSYLSISDGKIALIYSAWSLLMTYLAVRLLITSVDGFWKWEGLTLVLLLSIFISFFQISRRNLNRRKFEYGTNGKR